MREFRIIHRLDGVYWAAGDRERRVTSRQAHRLMSLVWKWATETEAITVIRRTT